MSKKGIVHIPEPVNEEFVNMATSMVDPSDGQIVESMAFLVGYQDEGGTFATHIVFPVQEGTCSRVTDCGKKQLNINNINNVQ